MNRYLALNRISVPPPSVGRSRGRPRNPATSGEWSAMGFIAAIVFLISAIMMGVALIVTLLQQ